MLTLNKSSLNVTVKLRGSVSLCKCPISIVRAFTRGGGKKLKKLFSAVKCYFVKIKVVRALLSDVGDPSSSPHFKSGSTGTSS